MKPLAICVVYLVTPENAGLMALHLDRIARHTKQPYTLFASVNRLDPELRRKLEDRPEAVIVPIADTKLRGSEEHAYYLDRLVSQAVAADAEYIATLHVDSFPVRDGWDDELIATLSAACPVAAVTRLENRDEKPHPCGMLFERAFYMAHRPTFRLSPDVQESMDYRAYRRKFRHAPDSGVGYGFTLFRNGLTWHRLTRSNRGEDHFLLGSVYGDLIFHLGAAARTEIVFQRDRQDWEKRARVAGRPAPSSGGWRRLLPARIARLWERDAVPDEVDLKNRAAFALIRDRLLADPEAYLDFLRTGRPPA